MSSFIRFEFNGHSPSGKTKRWLVITTYEPPTALGSVAWYSGWRCYAFFPNTNTLYEKRCLRDIADFCEQKTNDHRNDREKPAS